MRAEPPKRASWSQNPDQVRADILRNAADVFAESGFTGARIEEIAGRTATSKRMIYYYFGDKSGLYRAVLEDAYGKVRAGEDQLQLAELDPTVALCALVDYTFDYHRDNPNYVRLVAIENIRRAESIERSEKISEMNFSAIEKLSEICRRGVADGAFRPELDPLRLHWLITSFCVFNVSNRATFSALFGEALYTSEGQSALKQFVRDAVLGAVVRR